MKILVAEDGRVCAGARAILENLGHEITVATTGTEAWACIGQEIGGC